MSRMRFLRRKPPPSTRTATVRVTTQDSIMARLRGSTSQGTGTFPAPVPVGNIIDVTPATFAAGVSAATAGQTLRMAAGNYGNWVGTNKAILLIPASGANVTITLDLNSGGGGWTMDGGHTELLTSSNGPMRTQDPPFTSTGITITEMVYVGSSPPTNITISRCWFTGTCRCDTSSAGFIACNWVLDRCFWYQIGTFVPPSDADPVGCFVVFAAGMVLKNSLMWGCLSDGVDLAGGSSGIIITDSEFNSITSGAHPTVHTDCLQFEGSDAVTVQRNFFYNFEQALSGFDGMDSNVIVDNVIVANGSPDPAHWLCLGGDNPASRCDHNTVVDGNIECGAKNGEGPSISNITNNICSDISLAGIGPAPGVPGSPTTNTHNMFPSGASSPNINGTPVYVGPSTTYQGYKLAPGSPGKNAATDGFDIGARIQ